jgi:hypothetical protein
MGEGIASLELFVNPSLVPTPHPQNDVDPLTAVTSSKTNWRNLDAEPLAAPTGRSLGAEARRPQTKAVSFASEPGRYCEMPSTAKLRKVANLSPIFWAVTCAAESFHACIFSKLSN